MTRSATRPTLRPLFPSAAAPLAAAALILAGCAGDSPPPEASAPAPAPSTSAPSASSSASRPSALGREEPDSRGVIVYRDYAAVVARQGDSVQAMASRVGVSPSELAAYNGLPTSYQPTAGDELVLPPREGGYGDAGAAASAAQPSARAQDDAPSPLSQAPGAGTSASGTAGPGPSRAPSGAPSSAPSSSGSGWDPARIGEAIEGAPDGAAAASPASASAAQPRSGDGYEEVAYHEVQGEQTVYSIARSYNVSAETLIAWNALSGPNYAVRPGQVLVIPGGGGRPADGAPGQRTALNAPGQTGEATPPPSAGRPLPPDTEPARPLASPELGQYQTETAPRQVESRPEPAPEPTPEATRSASASAAASAPAASAPSGGGMFTRPVPGEVIKAYNRQPGGERNDGVDFAAEVGAPVRAAADGTVALVSTSLGEWGNIVLLRHEDRLMTVYGRMGAVAVSKGESVRAGDVLGDVAEPDSGPASLHFEVRRGAFSEDPMEYF